MPETRFLQRKRSLTRDVADALDRTIYRFLRCKQNSLPMFMLVAEIWHHRLSNEVGLLLLNIFLGCLLM